MSWVVWTCFGFLYYGIILLSANELDDDDSCSFDYSILFFAASSELVANILLRSYIDAGDRRTSAAINFIVAGVAVVLLPLNSSLALLIIFSFLARGTAYTAAALSWIIT